MQECVHACMRAYVCMHALFAYTAHSYLDSSGELSPVAGRIPLSPYTAAPMSVVSPPTTPRLAQQSRRETPACSYQPSVLGAVMGFDLAETRSLRCPI